MQVLQLLISGISQGCIYGLIALGFFVAFVVALAVIKLFVAYVSRSGFAPFAWYRIAAGALAVFLLGR